jgi:hypothetical protein
MVDAGKLLALLDWAAQSREYVRGATDHDNLDMTQAVKQYHHLVVAFDDWCVEDIKIQRRDLLAEFDQRRAELRELQAS